MAGRAIRDLDFEESLLPIGFGTEHERDELGVATFIFYLVPGAGIPDTALNSLLLPERIPVILREPFILPRRLLTAQLPTFTFPTTATVSIFRMLVVAFARRPRSFDFALYTSLTPAYNIVFIKHLPFMPRKNHSKFTLRFWPYLHTHGHSFSELLFR